MSLTAETKPFDDESEGVGLLTVRLTGVASSWCCNIDATSECIPAGIFAFTAAAAAASGSPAAAVTAVSFKSSYGAKCPEEYLAANKSLSANGVFVIEKSQATDVSTADAGAKNAASEEEAGKGAVEDAE